MSELARVTRPGGMCMTYMWACVGGFPLTPLPARKITQRWSYTPPMPPGVAASSRAGLEKLWQDAGFSDVSTETFRITVSFEDFEDFWLSNSAGAGPRALCGPCPRTSVNACAATCKEPPANAEGRISYPAVANAVKGIRRA